MKRNHYGIIVDSEKPVISVVTNHQPEYLCNDIYEYGIDIDLVEYLASCESDEDIETVMDTWEQGTLIYGFREWLHEGTGLAVAIKLVEEHQPYAIVAGKKIFVPDHSCEYQAIVGEVYTQVLRSEWVQRVDLCLPRYPGQGDLDTPGDFLAYTLPKEIWGNRLEWREISRLVRSGEEGVE